MVSSIDSSLLLSFYNARSGATSGAVASSTLTTKRIAPTAPWSKPSSAEELSAAVKAALSGRSLINESNARLDLPGASDDYRKLFALYQGLSTLGSLVEEAQKKNLTPTDKRRIQASFANGLAEVSSYVSAADLDKLRLSMGTVAASAKTTAPIAVSKQEYTTGVLWTGKSTDSVPQFEGAVSFNIAIKRSGATTNVAIDLAEMGTQTRSVANVINFINGKLTDAGAMTRFAAQRTPGADRTTTVGGKTVTLGPGADQWALKVKPNGESVTFSAATTAPAVYMTQTVGNPDPDGKPTTNDAALRQQFLKIQTDSSAVPPPVQGQNEANWVEGRAFARTLGPEVKTVRASQVGPDGSVYMLADVTDKIAGQALAGKQDVALLKYDPAGNMVYSRTLGASDTASGLGLAVAADGRIAIAGSVTGRLNGVVEGALNSSSSSTSASESDSFVTVFNADGEEMWTQRRGARKADEASQVAFGANGEVYVAGRSQSELPGAVSVGGWDSYLEAFSAPDAKGKVTVTGTQMFGTTGVDKAAGLVVDGTSVLTASVENGRGVLRRFDTSSGAPVLVSTRDLGDLMGGDITGLALDGGDVVVGSTGNAALNAGSVTRAHAGGMDAFAARLSATLSAGAGDAVAYYGGSGDDRATALSVSDGKVFISGSAGAGPVGGQALVGKKDGFIAELDIGTGALGFNRRLTGKDGFATPTSMVVDGKGSSVLDRLGLPSGTLDLTDSAQIIASTSIRAGDQFTVKMGEGRPKTITIDAGETLDTLVTKLKRASGYQAKIRISRQDGVRKIIIEPQTSRGLIEFGAGSLGKDALELLGIPEGVVRATVLQDGKTMPADGKGQIYGLSLAKDLNLSSVQEMAHAASEIAAAMGIIRTAYKDLKAGATPPAEAAAAKAVSGPVPQYLTNQISNYQAALDRLGG